MIEKVLLEIRVDVIEVVAPFDRLDIQVKTVLYITAIRQLLFGSFIVADSLLL